MVERLDLRKFEQEHSDAGRPGFPPQLLLKVWLYAYALGVTSSRRIEQRIHEDLGFRFLAGGWKPDHWTLNEFRRRHPKALNEVFTQVLEAARELRMARLGTVAIEQLRRERARLRQRIRRWQKQCDRDGSEPSGGEAAAPAEWRERLEQIPRQLEQLRKSGQKRGSRTDPESRYLRQRGGFCLGYTAELAVSGDHLIVGQRVQAACGSRRLGGDDGNGGTGMRRSSTSRARRLRILHDARPCGAGAARHRSAGAGQLGRP